MSKIAIVYHSGYGHTEVLAKAISEGAKEFGAEVTLMKCEKVDFNVLNASDAIIFGCPTYMGTVSAEMKVFMDSCNPIWKTQRWRNKIAAGFTNSTAYSGDKLNTLMQFVLFSMQMGMVWAGLDIMAGNVSSKGTEKEMNRIGSWVGMMGQSNSDETAETAPPESDRKTARYFGKRIAELCKEMK